MEKNIDQRLTIQKRTEFKRFGISFGIGMAIFALLSLWRGLSLWLVFGAVLFSVFHFGCAFFRVEMLRPMYIVVTSFGRILGRIITTGCCTLVFYLIFSPFALLLRLFHKDIIADNSRYPAWFAVREKDNDPQRITRLY